MPRSRLHVLLVLLEFPSWGTAKHCSYLTQLALEEGLRANGVEPLTITTPWLPVAARIYRGMRFDQVWIDIGRCDDLDEQWLDWIAGLAPVRLGFINESLEYTPEEIQLFSVLVARKRIIEQRLGYFTHAAAGDERDAEDINARRLSRAFWNVTAVPRRFINGDRATTHRCAVFSGATYGERDNWLQRSELKDLLIHVRSGEDRTLYPFLFAALHRAVPRQNDGPPRVSRTALALYLQALRFIRGRSFELWLRTLQMGTAVVNLPHCVKAYPGRVFEAMSMNRPVITWEIPDRPRTKALFEEGREILYFDKAQADQLAAHIQHIMREPRFGQTIASNARARLRRFHTTEYRVRQILRWLDTGEAPVYG